MIQLAENVAILQTRNAELETALRNARTATKPTEENSSSSGVNDVHYRQLQLDLEDAKQSAAKYRTERNQLIKVLQKQQQQQQRIQK